MNLPQKKEIQPNLYSQISFLAFPRQILSHHIIFIFLFFFSFYVVGTTSSIRIGKTTCVQCSRTRASRRINQALLVFFLLLLLFFSLVVSKRCLAIEEKKMGKTEQRGVGTQLLPSHQSIAKRTEKEKNHHCHHY